MYVLILWTDTLLFSVVYVLNLISSRRNLLSVSTLFRWLLHLFTVSHVADSFFCRKLYSHFKEFILIYWSVAKFECIMLGCIVSGRLVCSLFRNPQLINELLNAFDLLIFDYFFSIGIGSNGLSAGGGWKVSDKYSRSG